MALKPADRVYRQLHRVFGENHWFLLSPGGVTVEGVDMEAEAAAARLSGQPSPVLLTAELLEYVTHGRRFPRAHYLARIAGNLFDAIRHKRDDAKDPALSALAHIAGSPALDLAVLAGFGLCPPVIDFFFAYADPASRIPLASSRMLQGDLELARRLLQDPAPEVRKAAIMNPAIPVELCLELRHNESDAQVRTTIDHRLSKQAVGMVDGSWGLGH